MVLTDTLYEAFYTPMFCVVIFFISSARLWASQRQGWNFNFLEYLTVQPPPYTLVPHTAHPIENSNIKTSSPRLVCILFFLSFLQYLFIGSQSWTQRLRWCLQSSLCLLTPCMGSFYLIGNMITWYLATSAKKELSFPKVLKGNSQRGLWLP